MLTTRGCPQGQPFSFLTGVWPGQPWCVRFCFASGSSIYYFLRRCVGWACTFGLWRLDRYRVAINLWLFKICSGQLIPKQSYCKHLRDEKLNSSINTSFNCFLKSCLSPTNKAFPIIIVSLSNDKFDKLRSHSPLPTPHSLLPKQNPAFYSGVFKIPSLKLNQG